MIEQIFKAYDVRATYPDKINEAAAWKVGYAAGQFLSRHSGIPGNTTMLVSRDMRPHSQSLCEQLSNGIRCAGVNVVDLGECDTSFMYFAVNQVDNCVGGIQTTASHNPINYNGFKISGQKAVPIGADTGLNDIKQGAAGLPDNTGPDTLEPTGSYKTADMWAAYREHVLQFLEPLKRKLKVFVDASNGMAGKMVPAIFDGVENLELIPLNYEMGQGFAHEPNPLVAENMVPTQEGVKSNKADLGACFDGDADRCIITDDAGEIIGCDHLTALLAEYFLKKDPGSTIVYDLRSSKVVEETITSLGGKPRKGKVGHVFMKAALRESGGVFGGELSGHFYFRDNSFADSGAIAMACVLSILGNTDKTMSDLINPLRKYPQSGEINFKTEDKEAAMQSLRDKYSGDAEIDDLDGVTVDAWDAQGWWANVRASNTEPLLRLNAEAKDDATLEKVLKALKPMLGEEAVGH